MREKRAKIQQGRNEMKRTLENCGVIKMALRTPYLGAPEQENGKCSGYVSDTDELFVVCKECKLNVFYEEAKNGRDEDVS